MCRIDLRLSAEILSRYIDDKKPDREALEALLYKAFVTVAKQTVEPEPCPN